MECLPLGILRDDACHPTTGNHYEIRPTTGDCLVQALCICSQLGAGLGTEEMLRTQSPPTILEQSTTVVASMLAIMTLVMKQSRVSSRIHIPLVTIHGSEKSKQIGNHLL
jgi:hypothetical protein